MEPGSQETQPEVHGNTYRKSYEVSGVNIDVNYRILSPKKEHLDTKTGNPISPASDTFLVFMPGWAVDAGTKTAEVTGQAFAEAGNQRVFTIDTKPDRVVNDTLYKEAEAISRLILETGTKNITIAGYSEGGVRAIDLAVILQQNPGISVNGVILMESMGLYDQGSKKGFIGRFLKTTLIDTPPEIIAQAIPGRKNSSTQPLRRGLTAGRDVPLGVLKDFARTPKADYKKRINSQINEMAGELNHLAELETPVILVQGVNDLVSNPGKVLPEYKDMDDATLGYGKGLNKQVSPDLSHALYNPLREDFLRKTILPRVPYVRMITAERHSSHGLPVVRAEQVAKDSLYLLERYRRRKI